MIKLRITVIVLLLLLGAASWYGYQFYKAAHTAIKPSSKIAAGDKKVIQSQATNVATKVAKNGFSHTVAEIVKDVESSDLDKVQSDLLDTTDALNIERDKVKNIVAVNVSIHQENEILRRQVTEAATLLSFDDGHFALKVTLPKDSNELPTFDRSYNAELLTSQYDKQRWLIFNRRFIDIYSTDPKMTISGIRTMTVEQVPPFAVTKVQAATEYDLQSKEFLMGGAVSVDLGRVNVVGKYLYNPSPAKTLVPSPNMRWVINANFNLIRL